jgi:type I restriction enzyme, S subunit
LDRETKRLDELVRAKEGLLELVAEKRRALITRAVTRGLNPKSPLRDSGIPWLGMIPAHWEIERSKWLLTERDERSTTGEEEMLTVSHITGVTPRSEKDVNMFEAETNEGYKLCQSGDLVINTLWAWMGAMGTARVPGMVSPAYNVYTPGPRLTSDYVDALVRIPVFAQEAIRFSKGVWSSRLRLYPEGLYEIWFPVPPLAEQRAIVAHIATETAKLDALRASAERTIALLKERRSALISAAVTGKIAISDCHRLICRHENRPNHHQELQRLRGTQLRFSPFRGRTAWQWLVSPDHREKWTGQDECAGRPGRRSRSLVPGGSRRRQPPHSAGRCANPHQ